VQDRRGDRVGAHRHPADRAHDRAESERAQREQCQGDVLERRRIVSFGYDGGRRDLQRLRREKFGFIFQFANLIPFLTARENVVLPMELIGEGGRRARERAGQLLDHLGVADRADHLPEQLSGGEKQRVAIARALANEPKIILADEPTGSLDTERGLSIMRLLRQITNEHGTATLVVTHDTRMISEVDQVIHLQDGQVVDRLEEALAR